MASTVAPGCPVHADFDPLSPALPADPFAVLRELPAREAPVFYAPAIDYYVVTRYADIEAIFLDPETFSAAAAQLPLVALSRRRGEILLEGGHRPQPSMVSLDPPEHTRAAPPDRARVHAAARGRDGGARSARRSSELLDAVDPAAPFDLVAALAFPLPATIIFSFMGVPPEDYAQLKEWCGYRAGLSWGGPAPERAGRARREHGRLPPLPARAGRRARSRDRADDFTSALLAIHDEDPEALTLEEIASILFSLSFAGHETTNYLIGNVVRRLLEDRARWERVVADPALIPGAVEETLRFDPSVRVWRRVTTRPATLGGVELPAGAKLFLWLAAAGRDPSVFPEPDTFDLERDERPPPPGLRQRHPLLPGLGARQARGRAGARGAGAPLPGAAPGRGPGDHRSTPTSRSAARRRSGWWLAG